MIGPERLASQPRGPLEVELLRHARAERPSADDFARLATALGLGTAATVTSVASSAAAAKAPLAGAAADATLGASAGGLATAGSVTSGGGVAGLSAGAVKPVAAVFGGAAIRWFVVSTACVVMGAGAVTGALLVMHGSRVPSGSIAPSSPPSLLGAALPRPTPPTASIATVHAAPQRAEMSALASLSPEIEMLDHARSLIDSGQPDAALQQLDAYDARFPAGTLAPEARVIRIQALVRSGKRARAAELGSAFLTSNPASPHAHRIRHLLTPDGGSQL